MSCESDFVDLDSSLHERDTYLQKMALRHMKSGISRTMVLPGQTVNARGKKPICAFFTVAPGAIERETLPEKTAKRLPRYPIPVFLIAQLAVDSGMHGFGLGKITLVKALEYLWKVNTHMPAYAVVVDCLNADVGAFYKQYGFRPLGMYRGNQRLFLPMQTVGRLVAGGGLFPGE